MISKEFLSRTLLLSVLFLCLLFNSVYASHYYILNYAKYGTALFGEAAPTESSPPPSTSSDTSTTTPASSDTTSSTASTPGSTGGTTTGTSGTSYTGSDYSSTTTTTTNPDGSTTTTYTNTYVDPQTGQAVTSSGTSTSTTTTDPTTGATVTSYTSTTTYVDPQTGKEQTSVSSSTSSSYTDPTTGATVSVSKSDYTYIDPLTGEQKSSSSTSESTYNSATGLSETKSSGDWGTSYSYYDPATGVSKSESTWVDTRTGETHTSKSESSSRTETDPTTGATVTIYDSKYTYTDPTTGELKDYTSSSSSKSTTNADGSTTYVYENKYTDYNTGKEVTSRSESNYNPQTGESTSIMKSIDPETGEEVITSTSESKYDPVTGESYSKYTYTDPSTGKAYSSESTSTKDENGNYVYEYRYIDEETGEERETPYYGVFGGSGGTAYTYADETGTYTYQYDGSPPENVRTYITPDGSTYVYTDTANEQNAIAHAYGETFAAAVDSDLAIGVVEHDLLEENVEGDEVTREVIGEQIIPYTDYVEQIEERSDRKLTEAELLLVTQEYENFEERLVTAGKEHSIDVAPETYGQYVDLYNTYNIPEEEQAIKSPEDFEFTINLRDEYYAKRDELYVTAADLQPEERAAALRTLEEDYAQKYEERFGRPEVVVPLAKPGDLDAVSDDSLPALTPDSIHLIIEGEFGPEFQKLKDSGIPEDHPNWKALENQVNAKRDELLQKQETTLIDFVVTSCQDSVGGSSESCGQKAQAVNDIIGQCGIGDSGAACQETAQIIATQLGCESSSDKGSCGGETVRILSEVKDKTDDEETRDSWLYGVEITPERVMGQDTFEEYRACSSGGGSDCESRAEERFTDHAADLHEEWRAEYESLTPEQREEIRTQYEERREEFKSTVEPVLETVRVELPEEQRPVYDIVDNRFEKMEDVRLTLMEEFRTAAEEKGHDTALLNFYIEQFEQSLDGARDEVTHKDFVGAAGTLRQSNDYFELYIEEAAALAEAESAGEVHEASDTIS